MTTEIINYNPIREKQNDVAREFIKSAFNQIQENENNEVTSYGAQKTWSNQYQETTKIKINDNITISIIRETTA